MSKSSIVLILLAMVSAAAMEGTVPLNRLKRGTVIPVQGLRAFPITEGGKYAGGGGFLFRYRNDPYVRYAAFDGKTTYQYNTDSIPCKFMNQFKSVGDFASDGSSVYLLTTAPDAAIKARNNRQRVFISRYDIKGDYKSTVELDGRYDQCVRFTLAGKSEDMFLVSCQVVEKNKTEFTDPVRGFDPIPRVGLFQTNGQFLRWLDLPNDVSFDFTVVSSKDNTKWALSGRKPTHSLDAKNPRDAEEMIMDGPVERDSAGNVMVGRFLRFQGRGHIDQLPVVFIIDPNLNVRRIELEPSPAKYGGPMVVKLMSGKIIGLYRESDDASEKPRFILRVYDLGGKMVKQYAYDPFDFGFALLDWNAHRALFATQAGDPGNPKLGIIEGIE